LLLSTGWFQEWI